MQSSRPHSLKAASHCPEIDPRWTHENEPSHDLREFCLAANDFVKIPKVEADAEETQPGFIQ